MKCPRDSATLEKQVYEADIQVDLCPSCLGMWLDQGELERIQELVGHRYPEELSHIDVIAHAYELARQKARSDIACPACAHPLVAKEYGYCSQILIDACPHCRGIWLDRDEIQALEQFFEREHPHIPRKAGIRTIRKGFWASLGGLFQS